MPAIAARVIQLTVPAQGRTGWGHEDLTREHRCSGKLEANWYYPCMNAGPLELNRQSGGIGWSRIGYTPE